MTRLFVALFVFASYGFALEAQHVRVSVLDRGQADGIVIRTPNHRWVVIDGGTNRQQADLMEQWGVDTVHLAVISHRHFDHNGGMDDVLRRFTIREFVGRLDECPTVNQDNVIADIISDSGITAYAPNNQTFDVDGVTFTILPTDPVDDACPDDENNNSVIVRMDYGDFSMLFPGDADEDERDWLTEQHAGLLDVDVLKAAHHGATKSVGRTPSTNRVFTMKRTTEEKRQCKRTSIST